MNDAIIKINGKQGMDTDEDAVELTTVGKFGKNDSGDWIICYDESELSGMENTSSVITVTDENTVIMERTGGMSTRLVIQNGVRNNCQYRTPHGDLMIGIFGEKIVNNLSIFGGSLALSYTLDSNLQPISRNTVEITVQLK